MSTISNILFGIVKDVGAALASAVIMTIITQGESTSITNYILVFILALCINLLFEFIAPTDVKGTISELQEEVEKEKK